MDFDIKQAEEILSRTPATLNVFLRDLSEPWIRGAEGGETWSPFDVVGHLIHGEETDWIARIRIILEHGDSRTFEPFDRFAQLEKNRNRTLPELLDAFAALRERNLKILREMRLTEEDLERPGRHPALGPVTLRQLLATWVAHDLDHIGQIARAMAHQYRDLVGPWQEYLRVLRR